MSSNTNIGNTPVNQGYVQLIHTGETGGIDGTLRTLYDGDGTASDLQIASNKVKISTQLYIGSDTLQEYIQDTVGAMLVTNASHTNLSAAYDDAGDGAIDLTASGEVTLTGSQTLSNKTLAAPTLTGTTQGASITLSGDLTVNGTTTTVNQTNLDVSDNIIGLNRGAGSNANDSGLIIERGSTGDNAAIIWDESADKFTLGTTTSTPSATGDLTISTGTLVATIEGNVTGNVTGSASLNLLKSNNLSDLASASTARSNLGVDAAGTDNSTNVTLAGSLDYITLSGQEITRNAINLTTDVTGTLPVGNGGTGLTSISTLLNSNVTPTSLGLVIGTNVLAQQTIGIANDNLVEIDDADAADNDYAKFTANGLEGRSFAEVRSDLGLGTLAQKSEIDDIDQIAAGVKLVAGESFVDSDANLMTAAAINDRIESFGYGTGNGDMTGVSITASDPLDISQSNTTSGNYSATISLDASEFGSYLADMTDLVVGDTDELAVLDNGTLKRKQIDEIRLTAFDSTGFSSGISFDGSTANGVLTFKDSDEATVEANLTFDASDKTLLLDGTGASAELATFKWYQNEVQVAGAGTGNAQNITLNATHGTTLDTLYRYKITLTTRGTGTDTGAVYIVSYDEPNTTWIARMVSRGGSSSNHPLLHISGSNAQAYHNHSSTYYIAYSVQSKYVRESDGTFHNFGADYHWQRDVDTLSYSDGDVNIDSNTLFVDASEDRVGIGLTNPSATLHVQDSDGSNLARFKDSDSSHAGIIIAADTNGGHVGNSGGYAGEGIYFQDSAEVMRFYAAGGEKMRLTGTGLLGIGTTSPSARLEITGSNDTTNMIIGAATHVVGGGSLSEHNSLLFDNTQVSGASGQVLLRQYANSHNDSEGALAILTTSTGGTTAEAMRIRGSGNVGIGTGSPSYLLDVHGVGRIYSASGDADLRLEGGASNTTSFMIRNGAGNNRVDFLTGGSNAMTINSSQNVGIGTTSPNAKLHINNGNAGVSALDFEDVSSCAIFVDAVQNTNYFQPLIGVGENATTFTAAISSYDAGSSAAQGLAFHTGNTNAITEAMRLDSSQDAHFDQDVIAFSTTPSDIRLKKNFTKIENGLDIVNKLEGHTFNWKKGGDRLSAGFKAQEVEKILPHLVDEKKLPLKADDDKEYKILRYEEMIPYLVEAIKEQQKQINKLEEKLNG